MERSVAIHNLGVTRSSSVGSKGSTGGSSLRGAFAFFFAAFSFTCFCKGGR